MRQRQSPPTSNDMGAKDIGVNHFLNSEYRWLMMWPWKWYIFYFPHIHNIRKYYDGEKISLKILTNVHIFSIPEYRHITWEDTVIEIISLVILTDLCIFSPPLNTRHCLWSSACMGVRVVKIWTLLALKWLTGFYSYFLSPETKRNFLEKWL